MSSEDVDIAQRVRECNEHYQRTFGAKEEKHPIVLVYGTFEILHIGHVNLIRAARKIAGPDGRVIVGISTDEFLKADPDCHKQPVLSTEERRQMAFAMKDVDLVWRQESRPGMFEQIIKGEVTHVLVGKDWENNDWFKAIGMLPGVTVVYHERTEGISTTEIKRRIVDAAIEKARADQLERVTQ